MDPSEIRAVHVAALEEVDQVADELGPELLLRDVPLDQRPDVAEQSRARTPTHEAPSQLWYLAAPPNDPAPQWRGPACRIP